MRIISTSALRAFVAAHPQAEAALRGWQRVIEANRFVSWSGLKASFNTVDKVGDYTVFDIGGNKYRLIAWVQFERQVLYIKAVLTHKEYDQGSWKP